MIVLAAIINVSSGLGYALPAIIGLESMGLPSPGETALVAAAVLASQGKLQIWLVIVIAAASAIVGDNLGYLLGRRFGREVLEHPGPLHRRRLQVIAAGDRFFDKHGPRRCSSPAGSRSCASPRPGWPGSTRCASASSSSTTPRAASPGRSPTASSAISRAAAAADAITKFGVYAAVALAVLVVGGYGYLKVRERRAG